MKNNNRINYRLATKLANKITLNKGRKSFRFLGRDYIIGVRSKVNNGYGFSKPKGKQSRSREFYTFTTPYITLYRSARQYNWWFVTQANQFKHTLKSLF